MIRRATASDTERVAAIYAPYVRDTAISFEETPPTAADMAARLSDSVLWLVDCDDRGEVRGYAYAGPHRSRAAYRWCVDVSVYLDPAARGRGVGRALYEELLGALTELGYTQAFAGIALPNAASEGLHRALGFTLVGTYRAVGYKLGTWWDVAWYQRGLAGAVAEPREPGRLG
ncbi:GNAT family N-acetyltransferase [Pseudonocardia sp. WMMC193]|uniref:GNAT family N-acetyltransferase n=1 Tax=Pseudonocardia sp. WMMC193 TaxID=2911965 RepID=UPI001F320377|nr:GNAT family N-acetyltransferase [Pseudonocardia sp. WMMC193]MCF7551529.1 N-acetyltransferase family protein [Pseudonocardia sp. WMMC193]